MLVGRIYNRNGEKLRDRDGIFRTSDNQVAISGEELTPPYENTGFHDISLFMPYSQLEIVTSGKHRLKFNLVLWDMLTDNPRKIEGSEWKYLNYTR